MRRQKVKLLLGLLATTVLAQAQGEIQPGQRREQVVQELGFADSATKIGQTEVLGYKNGTRVTLTNGVVAELTRRGINGGPQGPRPQSPTLPPKNPSEIKGTAPLRIVEKTKPKPAVTREPSVKHELPATTVASAGPGLTRTNVQGSAATGAIKLDTGDRQAMKAPPRLPGMGLASQLQTMALGVLLMLCAVGIGLYLFSCYCYSRICDKAGQDGGLLVWLPILQFIPLFRVAQMGVWMVILLFIPIINLVVVLTLWAKICTALNKSPWLAATLLIPILNLWLIPYLAFSQSETAVEAT